MGKIKPDNNGGISTTLPYEAFVFAVDEGQVIYNTVVVAIALVALTVLAFAISNHGGSGLAVLTYGGLFLGPLALIVLWEMRLPRKIVLTRESLTVRFWYRRGWTHDVKRVDVKPSEAGVKILLLGIDDVIRKSFEVPKTYPGYYDLNETLDFLAKTT
jgi:hypothetical protein